MPLPVRRLTLAGLRVGMLSLLTAARPALAEPPAAPQLQLATPPTQAEDATAVEREWYGAPMLIVDVLAFGSLAAAASVEHPHADLATWLAVAGVWGYLVNGPAFHFFHKRFGMALASLEIRVGAPLVGMPAGALIGALVARVYSYESDGGGAFITGMALGFLGGWLVAAAVDDFAFARKPVESAQQVLSLVPVYEPVTQQTGLMLRGT
jgi:hypothetical protein